MNTPRTSIDTCCVGLLACRDPQRAAKAVEEIKAESKNDNVEAMQLDLGDLKSISKFVNDYEVRFRSL